MPVTLQYIDRAAWQADAQAQHDLARIYADAPAERLRMPVDNFIDRHLSDGHFFFCARFNDRLLGAVAVESNGEAWWLSNLCVRKTTRRRGVGTRLMALVSEKARAEGCRLLAPVSQLPMADQVLLARLGYRLTPAGDCFELDIGRQGGAE